MQIQPSIAGGLYGPSSSFGLGQGPQPGFNGVEGLHQGAMAELAQGHPMSQPIVSQALYQEQPPAFLGQLPMAPGFGLPSGNADPSFELFNNIAAGQGSVGSNGYMDSGAATRLQHPQPQNLHPLQLQQLQQCLLPQQQFGSLPQRMQQNQLLFNAGLPSAPDTPPPEAWLQGQAGSFPGAFPGLAQNPLSQLPQMPAQSSAQLYPPAPQLPPGLLQPPLVGQPGHHALPLAANHLPHHPQITAGLMPPYLLPQQSGLASSLSTLPAQVAQMPHGALLGHGPMLAPAGVAGPTPNTLANLAVLQQSFVQQQQSLVAQQQSLAAAAQQQQTLLAQQSLAAAAAAAQQQSLAAAAQQSLAAQQQQLAAAQQQQQQAYSSGMSHVALPSMQAQVPSHLLIQQSLQHQQQDSSGGGQYDSNVEAKREKRKQSNRDSARRSRLRREAEVKQMDVEVENLAERHLKLQDKLKRLDAAAQKLQAHNTILLQAVSLLEAKEVLPERLLQVEATAGNDAAEGVGQLSKDMELDLEDVIGDNRGSENGSGVEHSDRDLLGYNAADGNDDNLSSGNACSEQPQVPVDDTSASPPVPASQQQRLQTATIGHVAEAEAAVAHEQLERIAASALAERHLQEKRQSMNGAGAMACSAVLAKGEQEQHNIFPEDKLNGVASEPQQVTVHVHAIAATGFVPEEQQQQLMFADNAAQPAYTTTQNQERESCLPDTLAVLTTDLRQQQQGALSVDNGSLAAAAAAVPMSSHQEGRQELSGATAAEPLAAPPFEHHADQVPKEAAAGLLAMLKVGEQMPGAESARRQDVAVSAAAVMAGSAPTVCKPWQSHPARSLAGSDATCSRMGSEGLASSTTTHLLHMDKSLMQRHGGVANGVAGPAAATGCSWQAAVDSYN